MNVLYFYEDDQSIGLMYNTDDQDILDIEKTVKAWNDIDVGKNEPIYQAIKTIKEMKVDDTNGK